MMVCDTVTPITALWLHVWLWLMLPVYLFLPGLHSVIPCVTVIPVASLVGLPGLCSMMTIMACVTVTSVVCLVVLPGLWQCWLVRCERPAYVGESVPTTWLPGKLSLCPLSLLHALGCLLQASVSTNYSSMVHL